jgi:sarcosine oxidase
MTYDVIVVGVGSMGSATCYELAKRGASVLGIEQFGLVNDASSHSGQSRLIRLAYFEHPDYVPLLKKTYEGWRSIEQESGTQLLYQTGIAYYGEPDGKLITGTRKSVKQHNLKIDEISLTENSQFNIPSTYSGLFESVAGFVTPEKAILLMRSKHYWLVPPFGRTRRFWNGELTKVAFL